MIGGGDRLAVAVDHGFDNRNDNMTNDPDLESLHGKPRFEELVERATAAVTGGRQ